MNDYLLSRNKIQDALNKTKQITAEYLLKENLIDVNTYIKVTEHCAIILVEKGWWGKMFDKLFDKPNFPDDVLAVQLLELPKYKRDEQETTETVP